MNDDLRTCVVCGGPMGKIPGDICCREEDTYLLIKCKGHMREFESRSCGVDEVTELLYGDLAEFLEEKGDSIDNYDEEGVLSELERRVLRWINNKMIDFKNMKGIGFCASCGVPILAGRNKCSNCSRGSQVQGMISSDKPSIASPPKQASGMHSKR